MSEPKVEYLPTKDGKKAPQEFAIATHLALPCIKCGRKTMFLKAAFCHICKLLWFDGEKERIGPAKEMQNRPEYMSFTQLELERLEWILEHAENPENRAWKDWIKEKSEPLYQQWLKHTKWTPNATWREIGSKGT